MAIELDINTDLIAKEMERIQHIPYAIQHALYPAVAEVMDKARSKLAERLDATVSLPVKMVRRSIKAGETRISSERVEVSFSVYSKAIPLIEYDVAPKETTAKKGVRSTEWSGFSYALRDGKRRESSEYLYGAGLPFIAEMPGGHLGVYFRPGYRSKDSASGKPTWAVKQIYGPSMQYHFTPEMQQELILMASHELPRVLPRFVDQALAEYNAKRGTV